MDVDAVFREIGELGRQHLVYVAYMLMLNTYAAFHMIQVKYRVIFLTGPPLKITSFSQ